MILGILLIASSVLGQTEFVRGDYFPADFEFADLLSVRSEQKLSESASLAELRDGFLFREVGFSRYSRRTYATKFPGSLTIETVSVKDPKAAYSLLTLLRNSPIVAGPPGDAVSSDGSNLFFAQANVLVRIQSDGSADLSSRVARSVSNRIGRHAPTPNLLTRFPLSGYDSSSVRYYLGPTSLAKYAHSIRGTKLRFQEETEIAQASYTLDNQTGVLSLVDFPTNQLAEEYFNRMFAFLKSDSPSHGHLYFKRVGPLLGILEGNFEPSYAEKILSALKYTYSIQWIFDKRNRTQATAWGVPIGLLGSVVRSIVFTAVLCVSACFVGITAGVFRFLLRYHFPNNPFDRPDRTGMIRLKIHEK